MSALFSLTIVFNMITNFTYFNHVIFFNAVYDFYVSILLRPAKQGGKLGLLSMYATN